MLIERFPSRSQDRVIQIGKMPSYFSKGHYEVTAVIDEESDKVRALDFKPENVDPEIAQIEAEEFRMLRWIRFDPSSREKLPPLYRAYPETGIALLHDGPAYKSFQKQVETGIPWIRPSVWSKLELERSQKDADMLEMVFYPVSEFSLFATEDNGLDAEQANATYLYTRLSFRETMAFSAFRGIVFAPRLFFRQSAMRIDNFNIDQIWDDLPFPVYPFLLERFRVFEEEELPEKNAMIFFPLSLTPWHGNTDAVGMVRTDADGKTQDFFVVNLLNGVVDLEEVLEFVSGLPRNKNFKPVFTDNIFPLVPDVESGTYVFPIKVASI